MKEIIGVRFKSVGKIYYFNPLGMVINVGDNVIVETIRGIEFGTVVLGRKKIDDDELDKPLKEVIRIANKEDFARNEENKNKEKEAFRICNEKIAKHKLDMNLVDVEYTFDGNKLLFYFTADGRIDFRDLVKDLAMVFKTRIELRQIGVRDESKIVGSIGVCGRNICCSQFLGEFIPVSIKMAKEQGLSLNPGKISGICGRLMCCLKYEQDGYEEMIKKTPRVGSLVKTPDGVGNVDNVNLLKGIVSVKIDNKNEQAVKDYSVEKVTVIKSSHVKDNLSKIDEEILKTLEE